MTLLTRFQQGDRQALARLISLIERDEPAVEPILAALAERPASPVIGITGPAGAGKSSLIAALVTALRRQQRQVGILAIDPSSTRSGGAALGDRLRLAEHAVDAGVFLRSMATRGQLGGLAAAAARAVRLLATFGFDLVLVETVGVGQAEIAIARLADLVVVVQVPGLGDEVQALKAGLLEIADIIAVNKADRPEAGRLAAQLRALVVPTDRPPPPVVLISATTGAGIDELLSLIDRQLATIDRRLRPAGRRAAVGSAGLRAAVIEAALARLQQRLQRDPRLPDLIEQLLTGRLTLEAAAARLIDETGPPSAETTNER